MKKKGASIIGMVVVLTIVLALPQTVFALTKRPPQGQLAQQGYEQLEQNLMAQGFIESDQLRFGGLFGPLGGQTLGPSPNMGNPVHSRDMGFGIDEQHFVPINPLRQID